VQINAADIKPENFSIVDEEGDDGVMMKKLRIRNQAWIQEHNLSAEDDVVEFSKSADDVRDDANHGRFEGKQQTMKVNISSSTSTSSGAESSPSLKAVLAEIKEFNPSFMITTEKTSRTNEIQIPAERTIDLTKSGLLNRDEVISISTIDLKTGHIQEHTNFTGHYSVIHDNVFKLGNTIFYAQ